MKKQMLVSIIVSVAIIGSLSFFFLVDQGIQVNYPSESQIILHGMTNATTNLLEKDNIKALAMITQGDKMGISFSKDVTNTYLTNGIAKAKIEIMYDPLKPQYFETTNNLSQAVKSLLNTYNPSDVGVILIGDKHISELLEEADNFDALKKVKWYILDFKN